MSLSLCFDGAEVLRPDGLAHGPLAIDGGMIVPDCDGKRVDLSGYRILPGIVDIHGDGFERHLAPRRGAMKDMAGGLIAAEAELAANGVTTAVLAQFYSWEGGLRSPDFAARMLEALGAVRGDVVTDLRAQLRFETHMLEDYAAFEAMVERFGVGYVVFNDHVPHERLEAGRRPKRLNGTALKSGRSPEALLALMQALHGRQSEVPEAVGALAARLAEKGVRLGSHDDCSEADRAEWRACGVSIAEFPETAEAAQAARAGGDGIILGAPNVMRGGSHNGNVSALELITMGQCDALASDYHYPSLRRAALFLVEAGVRDLAASWALVSSGPARLLGLEDRGSLDAGKRADLAVLDGYNRLCATISGGRISYLSGDLAGRLI
ncbi:alpha-D-ribose 1-methylphosphonate 5-triphosphate diphosphatase [Alisedimentitalea sp. MJ-SS2]|uniref:alpha-D-ribose 1-methylphosphonate 5-triphosphate diphosphatase n=1 Tax=Aliisedimentitalea sp. MJ-SS2 TaxID=3049795 RepID=UPI002908ED6B|nr:alpha-D-ribose 1-methylphosphonate 5-triphosphate diphosphatase [Alisedimentitalea sp. MJ-SS2]MDU8927248.1 alpha-D-ribose 1-methylphosphonate 5-triphosphate diphosphatase [Alisedimentitalea sp. MJ-SS2]